MIFKQHLPNALTLGNLACGCLGIHFLYNGSPAVAGLLVFAGAAFDFADGFAARLLNTASPIGKELDSLADMVTFGVLPGLIALHYLAAKPGLGLLAFTALLLPLFAALRLAKFNTDTRQSDKFIGLPTPAMAVYLAAVPLSEAYSPSFFQHYGSTAFLLASVLALSVLMVAPLPLLALKFKGFGWAGNEAKYVLLLLCLLLFVFLQFASLPFAICLYVLISIFAGKPGKTAAV